MADKGQTVWCWLGITEGVAPGRFPPPSSVILLAHRPGADFFFSTAVKAEYRAFLMQALATAFKAESVVPWDLVGRNLASMTDALLYRDAQGPYKDLRLQATQVEDEDDGEHVKDAPTLGARRRRREIRDAFENPAVQAVEDLASKRARLARADEVFGKAAPAALERITFKVASRYTGLDDVAREVGDRDIGMTVRFDGADVVAGIREMARAGLLIEPLPKFLSEVHSAAATTILVKADGSFETMAERERAGSAARPKPQITEDDDDVREAEEAEIAIRQRGEGSAGRPSNGSGKETSTATAAAPAMGASTRRTPRK